MRTKFWNRASLGFHFGRANLGKSESLQARLKPSRKVALHFPEGPTYLLSPRDAAKMSRSLTGRLAAQSLKRFSPTARAPAVAARSFSQTSTRQDDKPRTNQLLEDLYGPDAAASKPQAPSPMSSLTETSIFKSMNQGYSSLDTGPLTRTARGIPP